MPPEGQEDTRDFPVKPEPAIARSAREGMHPAIRCSAEKRAPPFIMRQPEDTREIVTGGEMGGRRLLSGSEQIAEMLGIIFVLNRMEGRISEFLAGSVDCAALENGLMEAARRASLVEEGRSPKQEFFSKIPAELFVPAKAVFRAADDSPRAP